MNKHVLKARASAIGCSLLAFFITVQVLYLIANSIIAFTVQGASMYNPIGMTDWVVELIRLAISAISLTVPYLLLTRLYKLPPKENRLRFKKTKPLETYSFIGLFFALFFITILLSNSMVWFLGLIKIKPPISGIMPSTSIAICFFFIRSCVLPAVLEELLFRGVIQSSLTSCGERFAVIATSFIFALYHQNLSQIISVFVLSIGIGYVAIVTKSLVLPMILHFINNASTFFFMYTSQSIDAVSALALNIFVFAIYLISAIFALYYLKTHKIKFRPLEVLPNLKNSQSNAETLLSVPIFVISLLVAVAFIVLNLF